MMAVVLWLLLNRRALWSVVLALVSLLLGFLFQLACASCLLPPRSASSLPAFPSTNLLWLAQAWIHVRPTQECSLLSTLRLSA